jgi:hypothetical protein
MKQKLFSTLVLMVLGMATIAQASLIDRGNNFIYDTDLNITWYAVPHGPFYNFLDASQWAVSQTYGGVSGWHLPLTPGTQIGETDEGQMGHLCYHEPGFQSYFTITLIGKYWTGNLVSWSSPSDAWYFEFNPNWGLQGFDSVYQNDYPYGALLVHDGDVGASVPIPAAFWLLGSGLLGLIGIRRKIS